MQVHIEYFMIVTLYSKFKFVDQFECIYKPDFSQVIKSILWEWLTFTFYIHGHSIFGST